ncbi:putative lrr receptor-like serine/threonine-protein kinase [Quercus suber]|uniref:Lrr receptor-like serine/threonine-protein kinase n=1 Tax=Quercus suber TaxID=58331 RepID=A0AAW0LD63_QUESU
MFLVATPKSGIYAPEYDYGLFDLQTDVYSFGVVALEVLSGKSNNNYMPSDIVCLLDRYFLTSYSCLIITPLPFATNGNLMKLIDESLGSEIQAILSLKSGDFMDDYNYQNTRYIVPPSLSNISELYTTAHRSISLLSIIA